jgi:hypothetical protein
MRRTRLGLLVLPLACILVAASSPVGRNDGEPPLVHECVHHKVLQDRARFGIETANWVHQRYLSLGHPSLGDEGVNEEAPRTARSLVAVDGGWQPIRITVSYANLGQMPDHDCEAVGDLVKVRQINYLNSSSTRRCLI